jgi:hypothetical protein
MPSRPRGLHNPRPRSLHHTQRVAHFEASRLHHAQRVAHFEASKPSPHSTRCTLRGLEAFTTLNALHTSRPRGFTTLSALHTSRPRGFHARNALRPSRPRGLHTLNASHTWHKNSVFKAAAAHKLRTSTRAWSSVIRRFRGDSAGASVCLPAVAHHR